MFAQNGVYLINKSDDVCNDIKPCHFFSGEQLHWDLFRASFFLRQFLKLEALILLFQCLDYNTNTGKMIFYRNKTDLLQFDVVENNCNAPQGRGPEMEGVGLCVHASVHIWARVISQCPQLRCDIHNTEMVAWPSCKMRNMIRVFTYL